MSQPFAAGKYALALCDVCSLRWLLTQLREQTYRGRRTGVYACPDCWSPDHPQNFVPDAMAAHGADAEALRNPRPDPNNDRTLSGDPNWLQKLQTGVA